MRRPAEVPMSKFFMMVILLAVPLGLSACDTVYMATMDKIGYAKRDILSSRVKSARDAQEDAKKDIQSTLEKFGNVVSYQGGDLEATYKKLSGELESSEDSAETVRKRIRDVESVADSLFRRKSALEYWPSSVSHSEKSASATLSTSLMRFRTVSALSSLLSSSPLSFL